jgi:hypothetical protein
MAFPFALPFLGTAGALLGGAGLLGGGQQALPPAPVPPQLPANPVTSSMPFAPIGRSRAAGTLEAALSGTDEKDEKETKRGFDEFFGSIDKTLNSPSKVIGLGLLGQLHPALFYAGLLTTGLLGGK